jgi:hypothetical protein
MGFGFILLIGAHLKNNSKGLKRSLKLKEAIVPLIITTFLTTVFIWQPAPIRSILSLSHNLGAAQEMFKIDAKSVVYQYSPSENFKLKLEVKMGENYDPESPPAIAIWLENQSAYHIKTLHTTDTKKLLPYWSWKVKEYEEAKAAASNSEVEDVDVVTSATPNSSFDPRDYILPERNKHPFYLMIEVNQANDKNEHYKDQPSVIYQVEIDNQFPSYYQVLDMYGYPSYDKEEDSWSAYFPDKTMTTALKIIDSALLIIER